jgi:hypothetical protein
VRGHADAHHTSPDLAIASLPIGNKYYYSCCCNSDTLHSREQASGTSAAMTKSASETPSPKHTPSPRAAATAGWTGAAEHVRSASEPWPVSAPSSDDSCVNDVESFARTVAAVKSKSSATCAARPDLLASVLSHYAAKWLPDVSPSPTSPSCSASGRFLPPPGSPTAAWLKRRLLLESLVAALPPGGGAEYDDGITCDFLLKLLRAGSMVGADAALLRDLESRAARRLDQATLGAVMIPAFGHSAGGASSLLLDVPLVLRLVRGFLKEAGSASAVTNKSGGGGAAAARVARLVDAYLAEAALEAGLRPAELEELARAVPAHARPADDALYRAIDTYLKVPFLLTSVPCVSISVSIVFSRAHHHDSAHACRVGADVPIPPRQKGIPATKQGHSCVCVLVLQTYCASAH